MVIALGFSVVYIYNTEYTVQINLDDGAGAWGFGQILSMATAVPFMREYYRARVSAGRQRQGW